MSRTVLTAVVSVFLVSACSSSPPRPPMSLQPFTAEHPLEEFVRKSAIWGEESVIWGWTVDCPEDDCEFVEDVVMVTGTSVSSISITNNQEQGADEGDIVKRVGDYAVLLRRGRLFTFALPTHSRQLGAVDYIDVAPQEEDIDAWYDEILTHDNTIVLLGYSYEIDASLVRLFEIDSDGQLSPGKSYFFKSSDYFDPENYATRLVDGRLIIYMPRYLPEDGEAVVSGRIVDGEPEGIGGAFSSETIYQPLQHSSDPLLHTVANCSLDTDEFHCTATSIVGPYAQLFYISEDAVYLWLNSSAWVYDYFSMSDRYIRRMANAWHDIDDSNSDLAAVYRIPLNGGVPGFVEVKGWPVNQFSFRETEDSLQVLARSSVLEDETRPMILEVPLTQFGPQHSKLSDTRYEWLPPLEGYLSVNRFVGSTLLYDDWKYIDGEPQIAIWVKNLGSQLPPVRLPLDHKVERIEPVGDIAVAIGSDERTALGVSSIRTGTNPLVGQTVWLHRAVQADERSHSFNVRRDSLMDVIGLPIIYAPDDENYEYFWIDDVNDVHMTYFGLTPDLNFQVLGEFVGKGTEDDDCIVSCTDWYGDSRPFFIDDRIYALLGYELIEGYLSGTTLYETGRVDGLSLLPKPD